MHLAISIHAVSSEASFSRLEFKSRDGALGWMQRRYEAEIRFFIGDPEAFLKRIEELGGKQIKNYSFNDLCYKPRGRPGWDPAKKVLRVREWLEPKESAQVLFTSTDVIFAEGLAFKRTNYPEGKIKLYRGELQHAQMLLSDLGFEFWFEVRKLMGRLYELEKLDGEVVAFERVQAIGYVGEAEEWGEDLGDVARRMRRVIDALGLPRDEVTHKSLPRIVAEYLGLV